MAIQVALLRGINVGGKNSLPMKDLAAMFEREGCKGVRTYIQSGNVVFDAAPSRCKTLPATIARSISKEFGLTVPVILRTAAELESALKNNPFAKRATDPKALHVLFLADRPGKKPVAALDPDRSPPDRFEVKGRDVFLHCPKGVARTKLTVDYFDRTLATTSTMRNWNTVQKLVSLARGT